MPVLPSIRSRVLRRWLDTIHRRLAHPLLSFVFPTDCFACGRPLGALQAMGACPDCWTGFEVISPPACPLCAAGGASDSNLLHSQRDGCGDCLSAGAPAWKRIAAAVRYDDHASVFLLRAKIGRRQELFLPLGEQLAAAVVISGIGAGCSAVVPVPSHPWANLRRGFQPAQRIASVVARRLRSRLRPRVLRIRPSGRLHAKRLPARDRHPASETAIAARGRLPNQPVLLIDDVITTGGTAAACARELLRAGASEVRLAVWARTPAPHER